MRCLAGCGQDDAHSPPVTTRVVPTSVSPNDYAQWHGMQAKC